MKPHLIAQIQLYEAETIQRVALAAEALFEATLACHCDTPTCPDVCASCESCFSLMVAAIAFASALAAPAREAGALREKLLHDREVAYIRK